MRRTLARALEIEAATRERERLARDIHDSVLQVLAMVQRRGSALGGEAAELGRMAGEQEVALRTLVSSGLVPTSRASEDAANGAVVRVVEVPRPMNAPSWTGRHRRSALAARPARGIEGLLRGAGRSGAAGARRRAGAGGRCQCRPGQCPQARGRARARAWILVEDWGDEVIVTVRDDGPGIPAGRLEKAEGEGRMGVALSIRGRLRDLGGTAELISVPGQGTEVELKVPRGKAGRHG